jgi:hypothetical protein
MFHRIRIGSQYLLRSQFCKPVSSVGFFNRSYAHLSHGGRQYLPYLEKSRELQRRKTADSRAVETCLNRFPSQTRHIGRTYAIKGKLCFRYLWIERHAAIVVRLREACYCDSRSTDTLVCASNHVIPNAVCEVRNLSDYLTPSPLRLCV